MKDLEKNVCQSAPKCPNFRGRFGTFFRICWGNTAGFHFKLHTSKHQPGCGWAQSKRHRPFPTRTIQSAARRAPQQSSTAQHSSHQFKQQRHWLFGLYKPWLERLWPSLAPADSSSICEGRRRGRSYLMRPTKKKELMAALSPKAKRRLLVYPRPDRNVSAWAGMALARFCCLSVRQP